MLADDASLPEEQSIMQTSVIGMVKPQVVRGNPGLQASASPADLWKEEVRAAEDRSAAAAVCEPPFASSEGAKVRPSARDRSLEPLADAGTLGRDRGGTTAAEDTAASRPSQTRFLFGRSESKVEEMLKDAPQRPSMSLGEHVVNLPDSGPSDRRSSRKVNFEVSVDVLVVEAPPTSAAEGDTEVRASERVTSSEPLLADTVRTLTTLFNKMDADGSGSIGIEEAAAYWGKSFPKVSAAAMFNEVDVNGDGTVTCAEFVSFWQGVKNSGYNDEEIVTEVELLLEGNTWADWKDGRST